MICLFNGCSHSEGSNGIFVNETWTNIVLKSISKNSTFLHIHSRDGFDNEHLFKHLDNIELDFSNDVGISVARSGKGNDAICFETINYVEYLKQINKKPDYVFIQWSGPTRKLFQTVDDKVQFINPHNIEELGIEPNWEPLGSSLTLTYYVILQNYLEKNNIEYVFIDYPGVEERVYNPYLKKSINYNRVVSSPNNLPLLDYLIKNNLNVDKDGHPNRKGYRYLSQQVLNILGIDLISSNKWNTITKSEVLVQKQFNYKFITNIYTVDTPNLI